MRKKRKLRILPLKFAKLSVSMAVLTQNLLKKWNKKCVSCFHNSFRAAIILSFQIHLEKLNSMPTKQGVILIKMKVKLPLEMLEQVRLILIDTIIHHLRDKLFWRKKKKKLLWINNQDLILLSVSLMDNKLTMFLLIYQVFRSFPRLEITLQSKLLLVFM